MAMTTGSRFAAGARFLFLACFLFLSTVHAAGAEGRIDVTIHGVVKHGVVAIGAETTGTTISANGVTWDLELKGRQAEAAAQLDGRMAIVTGRLEPRRGVERRERYVVIVTSIKPAGAARAPSP
jgi:hypothetical protein